MRSHFHVGLTRRGFGVAAMREDARKATAEKTPTAFDPVAISGRITPCSCCRGLSSAAKLLVVVAATTAARHGPFARSFANRPSPPRRPLILPHPPIPPAAAALPPPAAVTAKPRENSELKPHPQCIRGTTGQSQVSSGPVWAPVRRRVHRSAEYLLPVAAAVCSTLTVGVHRRGHQVLGLLALVLVSWHVINAVAREQPVAGTDGGASTQHPRRGASDSVVTTLMSRLEHPIKIPVSRPAVAAQAADI